METFLCVITPQIEEQNQELHQDKDDPYNVHLPTTFVAIKLNRKLLKSHYSLDRHLKYHHKVVSCLFMANTQLVDSVSWDGPDTPIYVMHYKKGKKV